MKKKTGIIVSSVAAIAVCTSMIAGSTFALFTDSSEVNIAVGTASVKVEANISDLASSSELGGAALGTFAENENGEIELFDMAPGDKYTFNVNVKNNSTVSVYYKTELSISDPVLASALKVTVGDDTYESVVNYASGWTYLEKNNDPETVGVAIEFPAADYDQNMYQDLNDCVLSVKVTAVQSNGVEDPDAAPVVECVSLATPETAQAMLDDSSKEDQTIVLAPGYYGALYLGVTDFTQEPLNLGDNWAGGNKAMKREINGLTIVGTEGAVVEKIVFENGMFGPASHVTLHPAHVMPESNYLNAHLIVNDLTIKNVEFSCNSGNALNLGGIQLDGLTIDGCKMVCDPEKVTAAMAANDGTAPRLLYWAGKVREIKDVDGNLIMRSCKKNITVTNCYIENAYMGLETRGTENIVVTNNRFVKVRARDLLLTWDAGFEADRYVGKFVVSGNISTGGTERFLRANGTGSESDIVITNNTVTNYSGADDDYIKISSGNEKSYVIEGNSCTPAQEGRDVYISYGDNRIEQ